MKVRSSTLIWVIVVEILIGAFIWFGNAPAADAQPSSQGSAITAPTTPTTTAPGSVVECPKKKSTSKKSLAEDLIPIGILILVIIVVIVRLPKVELGHTPEFRRRRLLNWLPLGLTYSFLYFARYNMKQFQGIGLTEAEYGTVFGVGSAVYGLAFLLNGPLTDRWGGRATILISCLL